MLEALDRIAESKQASKGDEKIVQHFLVDTLGIMPTAVTHGMVFFDDRGPASVNAVAKSGLKALRSGIDEPKKSTNKKFKG